MSDNGGEQQEVKPENQHVALKLQGQGFPELVIKVKRTTKLSKMMQAYCDRAGKSMGEIRFMHDGNKLVPEATVNDLDLDDVDEGEEVIIDVAQEAIGGCL
ncbi:hypothetical protein BMF94_0955 [Rhodotorula taiwanensis]|uniref:Ubiquitin-like domain-containing protein n=1 Tax=Rhodotorula taiwanensis TaxID=741276 RepID=A0A2S5BGK0_9BASI|nr:hypothetical protein BMF94_0955 [Rhodotorula taiwanensis]